MDPESSSLGTLKRLRFLCSTAGVPDSFHVIGTAPKTDSELLDEFVREQMTDVQRTGLLSSLLGVLMRENLTDAPRHSLAQPIAHDNYPLSLTPTKHFSSWVHVPEPSSDGHVLSEGPMNPQGSTTSESQRIFMPIGAASGANLPQGQQLVSAENILASLSKHNHLKRMLGTQGAPIRVVRALNAHNRDLQQQLQSDHNMNPVPPAPGPAPPKSELQHLHPNPRASSGSAKNSDSSGHSAQYTMSVTGVAQGHHQMLEVSATSMYSDANSSIKNLSFNMVSKVSDGEDELGFRVINNYILLEEAGRGKFGVVFLASETTTGSMRAIKVVPKRLLQARFGQDTESFNREVAIMKKLRHKNVVALLEVIDDPSNEDLFLVMPYVEKGPLLKLQCDGSCTPLDIDVARGYLRQVARGLKYLHDNGIAHRDIKPDNILLGADGVVHLTDFGVSDIFEETTVTSGTKGTPAFAAPEMLTGDAFQLPPTDVWALGVTIYVLLFGRMPFRGHNLSQLNNHIRSMNVSYDLPPNTEDPTAFGDAIELLQSILIREPTKRLTMKEVLEANFFKPSHIRRISNHSSDESLKKRTPKHMMASPPGTGPSSLQASPSHRRRSAAFQGLTLDIGGQQSLERVELPLADAPFGDRGGHLVMLDAFESQSSQTPVLQPSSTSTTSTSISATGHIRDAAVAVTMEDIDCSVTPMLSNMKVGTSAFEAALEESPMLQARKATVPELNSTTPPRFCS